MIGTYPVYFWASIYLGMVLLYLIRRYGLASIPTVFAGILIYPALVPFITTYLYGVEHFTILGAKYESVAVADRVVLLVALFLSVAVLILRSLDGQTSRTYKGAKNYEISLPYDRVAFPLLGLVALVSVYLIAPGPTIFSSTYSNQNPFPWATFAGSLYKGAWALMFAIIVTTSVRDRRYLFFLSITVLGTGWLLLHGRRVESIGMVLLLFADLLWHRFNLRIPELPFDIRGWALSIAVGLYGMAIVVVGRIRTDSYQPSSSSGSGGSAAGSSTSTNAASEMASTLVYGDGFVGLPGGAHGTYGTMQATVHLFPNKYEYLYGETFINYLVQAVPTPMLVVMGVSPPPMYRHFLAAHYNWNGGNYILNVYFANFGILGVVMAGMLLALLLHFLRTELRITQPQPRIFTAIAAVFFINVFRAFWYTQLNWVDGLQGLAAVFVLYYGIHLVTTKDKRSRAVRRVQRAIDL